MGASLGTVSGVGKENRDTGELCLIDYKPDKLAESPLVVLSILRFPDLYLPYPLKPLQDNSSASLYGFIHNPPADEVIGDKFEPSLSARDFLKVSLSRASAFTLELSPQPFTAKSISFNLFSTEDFVIRSGSQIFDSQINADKAFSLFQRRFFNFKSKMEIVFAILYYLRAADVFSPILKPIPLIFTKDKGYLLPSPQGRNGSKLTAVEDKPEAPWRVKGKDSFLKDMLLGFIRLIRESNLISYRNGKLGSKTKSLPKFLVNKMVKGYTIKALMFPGYLGDVIHRLPASLQSFIKSFSLLWSWIKLTLDCYPHQEYVIIYEREVSSAVPPHAYAWGLRRTNLR